MPYSCPLTVLRHIAWNLQLASTLRLVLAKLFHSYSFFCMLTGMDLVWYESAHLLVHPAVAHKLCLLYRAGLWGDSSFHLVDHPFCKQDSTRLSSMLLAIPLSVCFHCITLLKSLLYHFFFSMLRNTALRYFQATSYLNKDSISLIVISR